MRPCAAHGLENLTSWQVTRCLSDRSRASSRRWTRCTARTDRAGEAVLQHRQQLVVYRDPVIDPYSPRKQHTGPGRDGRSVCHPPSTSDSQGRRPIRLRTLGAGPVLGACAQESSEQAQDDRTPYRSRVGEQKLTEKDADAADHTREGHGDRMCRTL